MEPVDLASAADNHDAAEEVAHFLVVGASGVGDGSKDCLVEGVDGENVVTFFDCGDASGLRGWLLEGLGCYCL